MIAFAQSNSTVGSDVASVAVAFDSPNTAGNSIIVFAGAWNSSSVGNLSVSDSAGNAYTLIQSDSANFSGHSAVAVWYANSITAGDNTVTVTAASGTDIDVIIAEYSGVSAADATSVAVAGTGSASVSAPSVTPQETDAALLVYGYDQTNSGDQFSFSCSPSLSLSERIFTSNFSGGESSAFADFIGSVGSDPLAATVGINGHSNGLYSVAILLTQGSSGSGGTGESPAQTQLTLLGRWSVTSTAQTVQAGFGTTPLTYAATGTLPTGLSLQSNGTLSGTPSAAGTFSFTITATDANGKTSATAITATIASADVPVDTHVCAVVLGWL